MVSLSAVSDQKPAHFTSPLPTKQELLALMWSKTQASGQCRVIHLPSPIGQRRAGWLHCLLARVTSQTASTTAQYDLVIATVTAAMSGDFPPDGQSGLNPSAGFA
jgi:hypothetical protein